MSDRTYELACTVSIGGAIYVEFISLWAFNRKAPTQLQGPFPSIELAMKYRSTARWEYKSDFDRLMDIQGCKVYQPY